MNIAEIRKQYPQYDDLSDEQLAVGLYQKFYSDMEFEDFSERIGFETAPDFSLGRLASQMGRSTLQGIADIARGVKSLEGKYPEPSEPGQLTEGGYLAQMRNRAAEAIEGDPLAAKRAQAVEGVKPIEEYAPESLEGTPKGAGGMVEQALSGISRSAPSMVMQAVNAPAGAAMLFTQLYGGKIKR